jgi:hypothetical protein
VVIKAFCTEERFPKATRDAAIPIMQCLEDENISIYAFGGFTVEYYEENEIPGAYAY